jgi:hypothetical protein
MGLASGAVPPFVVAFSTRLPDAGPAQGDKGDDRA